MRLRTLLVAVLLAVAARALAQQRDTGGVAFEVVSIKRNTSGSGSMSVGTRGGRFVATNTTTTNLILNGFPFERFRVIGAPEWADADRYDVTTSAAREMSRAEFQAAVRALLADRFRLVAHTERRSLQTYALVMARPDGRLGPNLRPWTIDCEALRKSGELTAPPLPKTIEDFAIPPKCGLRGGIGVYAGGGVSLDNFVRSLASDMGAPIVDHTGLSGLFEIALRWNPEPGSGDPSLPSLFTAIQEQLGLKLEPRREPVEVLVVDRLERPSED